MLSKRKSIGREVIFAFLTILSFSYPIFACEPIIPMMMLFGGSGLLTRSLWGLALGISIKCVAFAFFERSLPKRQAMLLMLKGNVLTTFVGLLLALCFAIQILSLFSLFVFFALAYLPADRLERMDIRGLPKIGRNSIAALVVLLLLLSFLFFSSAMTVLSSSNSGLLYWLLKLAYIYPALLISIAITSLWEEWVIFKGVKEESRQLHYYPAVLRANFITLLVLMTIAAVKTLPTRLQSPDFLAVKTLLRLVM
jgi:hypothetical protein